MEHLHREIMQLIIQRRKALTEAQIDSSIVGYGSYVVSEAIKTMLANEWMTSFAEKGKTYYQLTWAGYQMLEEV